ncbi:Xcc1710-like domain-containing protein [Thiorhodococcus mannitoliphagus]|uniref:Xcc1710-like domain-containing protein n=1 Tax=Thiorhodococcus mannitoliphagus TaxID=329406 RepID=A0A6P1DWL9_9GAMM|nr:Mth938-like domain-containing protein [Thiorhodococcus mannitoliphagus]NEX21391.1 Xcc1710-like domain-containing protein [Thiorhodococcus mannitoliphagus]
MRFAEADDSSGHLVEGYGPEGILVGGRRFRSSLILAPDRIVEDWGPSSAAVLAREHLETLLALDPQLIVLGTGDTQVFPPPEVYFWVMERGVGIEVMDTGAACRTYNILMSEGRRVAAGLILGLT